MAVVVCRNCAWLDKVTTEFYYYPMDRALPSGSQQFWTQACPYLVCSIRSESSSGRSWWLILTWSSSTTARHCNKMSSGMFGVTSHTSFQIVPTDCDRKGINCMGASYGSGLWFGPSWIVSIADNVRQSKNLTKQDSSRMLSVGSWECHSGVCKGSTPFRRYSESEWDEIRTFSKNLKTLHWWVARFLHREFCQMSPRKSDLMRIKSVD